MSEICLPEIEKTVEKRKVLFLSLGTSHEPTTYTMNDRQYHTGFVADALIDNFQPDEIALVGTLGSFMRDMFIHYAENNLTQAQIRLAEEKFAEIRENEKNKNEKTSIEDLSTLNNAYNQIFKQLAGTGVLKKIKSFRVILLPYGRGKVNDEENYKVLADRIKEMLVRNVAYEIAFDITHSFRSMPFLNLISLEYLRSVQSFQMRITHIFYGEFNRGGQFSPVRDLELIPHIMALNHAAEEFKDTGHPGAMINQLTDLADAGLRGALEKLDWSVQTNSYSLMDEAVTELLCEADKSTDFASPYSDGRYMIRDILKRALLAPYYHEDDHRTMVACWNSLGSTYYPQAVKQLQICKWLKHTGAFGQSLLVATESLRSLLMPISIKNPLDRTPEKMAEEKRRVNATSQLIRMANENLKDHTLAFRLLHLLGKSYDQCKEIRNRYAHNLSSGTKYSEQQMRQEHQSFDVFVNQMDDILRLLQQQEINGQDFCDDLLRHFQIKLVEPQHRGNGQHARSDQKAKEKFLLEQLKKEHFEAAIHEKLSNAGNQKEGQLPLNRIVISCRSRDELRLICENYKSSMKNKYEVYYIHPDFMKKILKASSVKTAALLLKGQCQRDFDDEDYLKKFGHIILHHLKPAELINASNILREYGCKNNVQIESEALLFQGMGGIIPFQAETEEETELLDECMLVQYR